MAEDKDNEMLEESPEIEVGEAGIPMFNLVVYAVLTVICVAYLFLHFSR